MLIEYFNKYLTVGWFILTFIPQLFILYIAKDELFTTVTLIMILFYGLVFAGIHIIPGLMKSTLFSFAYKWRKMGLFTFALAFIIVALLNGTLTF